MSQDVRTNRSGLVLLALYVVAPGVLLIGLVVFLLLGGSDSTAVVEPPKIEHQENYLAQVRSTLAKSTDLVSCKAVIALLNSHLQKNKEQPSPLSDKAAQLIREQFALSSDDLAEITSTTFTALDAYYLEYNFLLRDAARALALPTPGGRGGKVKQTPLDRAELAFAWVMRQVRLPQGAATIAELKDREPVPIQFVLRRSWGTALERALVFLALLEQFGLDDDATSRMQGALVFCPDEMGKRRLWACGVALGDRPEALYLFDPRMGLPVPGPEGKGIATLAQARSDKNVLGQLRVGELSYDVTPAQAKEVEICLVCPLTALAPRMVLLQNRLLREQLWVRVRLTEDVPAGLGALKTAAKSSGGSTTQVRLWREGATILRRFIPKEEGGSDEARVSRQLFQHALVPWQDFPRIFLNENQFQADKGLGLDLRQAFAAPFLKTLVEADSPREKILRGRPVPAARELVEEKEHWQQMRLRRQAAQNLEPGVREWVDRAISAYANEMRARGMGDESAAKAAVQALWRWKPDDAMNVLLYGAAAEGRGAEVTYQLGLCKHEVAAQMQARKELSARGRVELPEDAVKAAEAWKDAEICWKDFIENYQTRSGFVSARLRLGEAQALRGDVEAAIRTLKDLSTPMTDLEKLARLWLASQLAQRAKGK